jgi:hypothetical protein
VHSELQKKLFTRSGFCDKGLVMHVADHPLREQVKLLFFSNPSAPLRAITEPLQIPYQRAYKWAMRGNWFQLRELSRKNALKPQETPKQETSGNIATGQEVPSVNTPTLEVLPKASTMDSKIVSRAAISPEKMAEMLAVDAVDTKKGLSNALKRAAVHASETMTPDELIDKADKINNLTKAASTIHGWDGTGQGGHGGININILTDEVKIVQLSQDGKQSGS